MKIVLSSSDLKRQIGDSLKMGTGDATHPGFNLMHMDVSKKGSLRTTVVNAQAAVRLGSGDAKGEFESGGVAISLRNAEMMANVLPSGDVAAALSVIDTAVGRARVLRVRAGDVLLKMPVSSVDDIVPFPTAPEFKDGDWRVLTPEALKDIAKHCLWCCAPPTEMRPALQGVHMTPTYVEAADGHRLVRLDREGLVNAPVIVPTQMLYTLKDLADGADVSIAVIDNRIWARGRRFMATCRAIEAVYPPTDALYMAPDESGMVRVVTGAIGERAKVAQADVAQGTLWSAAASMAKIFAGSGKGDRPVLRFLVKDGELNVFMKSEGGAGLDFAQKMQWRMAEGVGQPSEAAIKELNDIWLDAQYVAQVVSSMPTSEFIKFTWTRARDRIQFESGDVRAVVMPRSPD